MFQICLGAILFYLFCWVRIDKYSSVFSRKSNRNINKSNQFSKDIIESLSGDATVSQLKQNTQRFIFQRQAFFHISDGCCICRLETKSHFKSWIQPTRVKLRFPIGSVCQVSQLTQVKLCFPNGSACSMSQIKEDNLRLPFGSACQMSQQIKCIRIQVDCRIHSKVPEPNAARFSWPLIVECHFNCQARLHQHQSKCKPANYETRSCAPFQRRSSLGADCWLQRSKSFPVDCRPIFESILGGSSIHSKHFMQQASTVDCWIHLHCQIRSTASEHLSARFGRRIVIHQHHINCQPQNFK